MNNLWIPLTWFSIQWTSKISTIVHKFMLYCACISKTLAFLISIWSNIFVQISNHTGKAELQNCIFPKWSSHGCFMSVCVCICNIHSPRPVLELSASWEKEQNKGKAESSATWMTSSLTDTLHSILSQVPSIPIKTIAVWEWMQDES